MFGINYYPDWIQLYILIHFLIFLLFVFFAKKAGRFQKYNIIFSAVPMLLVFILLENTSARMDYPDDILLLAKNNSHAYWERFLEHFILMLFFLFNLYLLRITAFKKLSRKKYSFVFLLLFFVLPPFVLNIIAGIGRQYNIIENFDEFLLFFYIPANFVYFFCALTYLGIHEAVIHFLDMALTLIYFGPVAIIAYPIYLINTTFGAAIGLLPR